MVLSEKGTDDMVFHFFAKRGMVAVRNLSSGDMEKLGRATGGEIVATLKDLSTESLDETKLVEEVKFGDDILLSSRGRRDRSGNGCDTRRFRMGNITFRI